MNWSDWPLALAEIGGQLRTAFAGLSLDTPGTLPAIATVALCSTAAVLVIDASRRTAAVPRWSYLRRDIAELAAERDGKRRLVENLRGECESLGTKLETLRSEEARLVEVTRQREAQEAVLRAVNERLGHLSQDRALVESVRADLAELQPIHARLKAEIAVLEENRDERRTDLDRLAVRQAELDEKVSQEKATREAVQAEVARLKAEFEALSRLLETARAELRQAEEQRRRELEAVAGHERERERLRGEMAALQARIEGLHKQQRELEDAVAAAQAARTKLVEGNGRLEADRSALWVEFIGLQEKRNAAIAEASAAEGKLWDLRQQRNNLQNEAEMLKRVVGSLHQNAAGRSPARA